MVLLLGLASSLRRTLVWPLRGHPALDGAPRSLAITEYRPDPCPLVAPTSALGLCKSVRKTMIVS
jgi:hypothetical protein